MFPLDFFKIRVQGPNLVLRVSTTFKQSRFDMCGDFEQNIYIVICVLVL